MKIGILIKPSANCILFKQAVDQAANIFNTATHTSGHTPAEIQVPPSHPCVGQTVRGWPVIADERPAQHLRLCTRDLSMAEEFAADCQAIETMITGQTQAAQDSLSGLYDY